MVVKLSKVKKFITRKLPSLLQRDLQSLRMVKEADLECCVYFHLRRQVGKDKAWTILARKHTRRTGHYIDLLLFKSRKPRIAIELKWNKSNIGRKDRESLLKSIKRLKTNQAYFISTIVSGQKAKQSVSPFHEIIKKYTIRGFYIPLALHGKEYTIWHNHRSMFMARMSKGKSRRGAP